MSYHYNLTTQNAEKPIESTKTMSTEGARRILLKDFGGKKAMRVLDRKEKMKINVDVVKDALDKTLMGNFFHKKMFMFTTTIILICA